MNHSSLATLATRSSHGFARRLASVLHSVLPQKGQWIFFRRLRSYHSSCPLSGVIVCGEPFVSSRCFSSQKRPPRPGWRCTPKRCSSQLRKLLLWDKSSPECGHTHPLPKHKGRGVTARFPLPSL